MAVDKEIKLEIRAFYESNTLSYAKVATHFVELGYEDYKKSMENWGRTDVPRWEKNKYADIAEALESLVDESVMDAMHDKAQEMIKNKIKGDHSETVDAEVLDEEDLEAMSAAAVKQLTYKILNKNALTAKMAQNLERAEKKAKKAKTIGVLSTYHNMLTTTYTTVHGKQTNIVLSDPNHEVKSDKELEDMSSEELQDLLEE